jgi:uncharacterized protein (DUF1684 family)
MKYIIAAVLINAALAGGATAAEPTYAESIQQWRTSRESGLRNDNGWLTLAGRFQMKPGANTFGTGKNNDIVFPPELTGVGPAQIGTFVVDAAGRKVTLKLAKGVWMTSEGKAFTGEREMGTGSDKRDWIALGRMTMHIIQRDGRFILRLANNESKVRESFPGRIWYDANEKFRVDAKFVPYPPGKKLAIVNVIDEVSDEPCPGYVEFKLDGVTHKMDVVGDDVGLFFVMRDGTSGDTTYRPSRFLYVEQKPQPNEMFKLDFNKAYNPPCAFSEYTTCPLPPEQNILKTRIEAGEKYRKTG